MTIQNSKKLRFKHFLHVFLTNKLQTKRGRNISQRHIQINKNIKYWKFIRPFGPNFQFDFCLHAFVLDDACMYL